MCASHPTRTSRIPCPGRWLTPTALISPVDPDRGRPVEQDDNLDLTAGGAPAATPYTYGSNPVTAPGTNEMAEANAYGAGYPSATGYGSGAGAGYGAGDAAAYGAAGAGAAGLGAGALYNAGHHGQPQAGQQQQYYQQSSQPVAGGSTGGAAVTRGPSSASALSGSTGGATSSSGVTPSSAGAGGITAAAAAKRAEAQRERSRLQSNGGFAEEPSAAGASGAQGGTYQHQDGGRMLENEDASDEAAEVPPTYDSIPADRR
jgi:hypothetical protein